MHQLPGSTLAKAMAWQLEPDRLQAITWTNADSLSTGSCRTNLSEIGIIIQCLSYKKMNVNMSSYCLSLKVLIIFIICYYHVSVIEPGREATWAKQGQCHGWWCPGSLAHQVIMGHSIDKIKQEVPCLFSKQISITWTWSILRYNYT